MSRTACKKFRRYGGNYTRSQDNTPPTPTPSDPSVVQRAWQCLRLAQRAPSSFNTQPYKVVLVHSPEHKKALSRYALGPNQKRVLDADCTAIFLADRQVMRTLPKYMKWQLSSLPANKQPPGRKSKFMLALYISLFSSGYPLPRFLAVPLSALFRFAFSILEWFTRWFYVLPTFCNAEAWAYKQVMPVAMVYMLACTSRGLATGPMEGINAAGIRKVLKIPRRYGIPLIVATGLPYRTDEEDGYTIAKDNQLLPSVVERYPMEDVIFSNQFGNSALVGMI